MKLSILIPTLQSRTDKLESLLIELYAQIGNHKIEVLWLGDFKRLSVGEKRNKLLDIASGEYITFFDDDDWPSEDYIERILFVIENKRPDVIAFHVQRYQNGKVHKLMKYDGVTHRPRLATHGTHYKLCCNHLCVWRKSIIKVRFPNKSLGEDHDWAMDMMAHYNTYHQIDKVLYHYRYDSKTSETHKRR